MEGRGLVILSIIIRREGAIAYFDFKWENNSREEEKQGAGIHEFSHLFTKRPYCVPVLSKQGLKYGVVSNLASVCDFLF